MFRKGDEYMRIFIFALAAIAAVFAVPVAAEAQQFRREHTIEIQVECIDEARGIINELNGYNLESNASLQDGERWATFSRRVDNWAFRHTQAVLREMGEVIHENENARILSGQITNLDTQIAVLSQEMERLSMLMAASDSLAVLIAINDSLNNVARDRDGLVGRRNVLLNQAGGAVIHIHLFETRQFEPLPPRTFGERVSRNFLQSWANTLEFGENLVVFVVRVSVPLMVWVVGATVVALTVVAVVKRRKGAKLNEAK